MGQIHSLEHFSTVDGPGIRFVAFLQGCPLQCVWCHNPDTWAFEGGSTMSEKELVQSILRYKPYFLSSGGGVTVSGGEPLMQAAFVASLFEMLHLEGIATCLDTAGTLLPQEHDVVDRLLLSTDIVLLDIKHTDAAQHRILTGGELNTTLLFLSELNTRGIPVIIRNVVLPGINDDEKDIRQLVELVTSYACVTKIELLPYHTLGKHKWAAAGLAEPLPGIPDMSFERTAQLQSLADTLLRG